ncbi:hypothetical protein [Nonomuraea dietziae]|uniref:hypothetical protein n=1 Tax=Nonomuraea dietziae TaxID=65515 RepID=UPI00343225BE
MSAVLLPSGVIRVPTISTLENGAVVHGTRDLTLRRPTTMPGFPTRFPRRKAGTVMPTTPNCWPVGVVPPAPEGERP